MIELRDYQAEAVEALRANIRAGKKNQVLAAPTGSGKTVVASYLIDECQRKGKRALFVCDRIPLINQTSETFDAYDIDHGVIQGDHWRNRPWKNVQVASAQTLKNRGWPAADLIVVDECHSMYKTITDRISKRDTIVIGLTATPFTKGMAKYYDSVVTVRTTNQLVADGFLAPFRVFAASEPDMTGATTNKFGEWTDEEAEKRSLPIVGDCVAEYLKHGDGKKFLAFGVTIKHCEEIQKQFMNAGVQCALYTSHTPDEERNQLVRELKTRDGWLRGLVSVSALSKGFDVAEIEVIIIARPLRKGFAEHIQILGRGLRPHPDKQVCTVLDHAGNVMRFWGRMQEFFEEGCSELDDGKRKDKKSKPKKEREPVKCSKCAHIHKPMPTCPQCGFEHPRRSSEIAHVAGELREFVGTVAEGRERHALYAQLLHIAREREYKEGWAKQSYREKTGVWPSPDVLDVTPMPPSGAVLRWVKSRMIAYAKRKTAA